MEEINFITIGDKNFFSYVHFSIKQLMKFYPNCNFFIYDWGFTEDQREKIKSYPISVLVDWKDKIDRESGYKSVKDVSEGYFPKWDYKQNEYYWNQKPICILDCSKRIKKNLFYLDGDSFLINKIDEIIEDDFDIGVAMASKEETKALKTIGIIGILSGGVIFFKTDSHKIEIYVQEWLKEIKSSKRYLAEETALYSIINQRNKEICKEYYNQGIVEISNTKFKVKTFPCLLYNFSTIYFGYDPNKVKILHFVSIRTKEKLKLYIKEARFRAIYRNVLRLFPSKLRKYIEKIFYIENIKRPFLFPEKFKWIKSNILAIPKKFRNSYSFFLKK